jgi:cobalt-zinc-cadmium efflux system membrane fusion protein
MLKRRRVLSLGGITFLILALGLAGCNHSPGAGAAGTGPAQVLVEEVHGNGTMQVEHPENFALATVEARPMIDELHATGVVAPDVNRSVPVLAMAGGRAVDLRVRLGDQVTKGQVMLVINSPDVSQAIADHDKAQADEALAQQQLTRAQDLYGKGALARQELEAAENAAKKAQVDLRAARQHLTLLGVDLAKPSPLVSIRAPISGAIVEQNVTDGTGVRSLDNSPNLFTIADLSRVWVLCDVYENDLGRVHWGETAELRLNAFPDRTFAARVGNISTVLDPTTRAAKVRLELANPGGLMRAGMFATATFRSQTAQLRPTIPTSAVMRLHDKDWVFVPLGGNQFRRTEVQAGPAVPPNAQAILNGLAPGDRVVANALQFASTAGME